MVPLKMPVKGKPGVQLQTLISIEQIGITPPRTEHEPQYSSSSELDRWVQYGRATDRGPTTFRMPSDRARVGATDNI